MKWEQMVQLEPALKTLKQLARTNPDSNQLRQLLDNYVGIFAKNELLRTPEAFDTALLEIFY